MRRPVYGMIACAFGIATLTSAEELTSVIQRLQVPGNFTLELMEIPLEEQGFQMIRPDHPHIYYTGRIDWTDAKKPIIIWQGTEIRLRFTGSQVGFVFSEGRDRNFFNVIVDGKVHPFSLIAGKKQTYLVAGLEPGEHEISLFKRSEAMYGDSRFEGFLLPSGEKSLAPIPRPFKIEFYGDSITAGACNEIEPSVTDHYEDLMLHNNYTSYGAICARRLGADYVNVAYSGIGISLSWHPLKMPDVWDKLYPRDDSPRYDFSIPDPDIVVVNLGQNDYGYAEHIKVPFPADFVDRYVAFLRALRKQYPHAWIILASGGMSGVKSSRPLLKGLQDVYKALSKEDGRLLTYTFKAFTYAHPRVETHEKLARELEEFIRKSGIIDKIEREKSKNIPFQFYHP